MGVGAKVHLVIIDPQNSFCQAGIDPVEQQVLHNGELCVPGAWEDMERVAGLVNRIGHKLDDIHVTLDSHHRLHIAHPGWFRNTATGAEPEPFTLMRNEGGTIKGSNLFSGDDVGEFSVTVRGQTKLADGSIGSHLQWTLDYLDSLAANKRYPHCIWPVHCLIATPGYQIVAPLYAALDEWCKESGGFVNLVTKGSNYKCEHFSAVRAEVADPGDHSTGINSDFIETVMEADEILLTGEALSHCLANTARDIANLFASKDATNPDPLAGSMGSDDEFIKKCVLLTDASSNVTGCDKFGDEFIADMTARGMRTTTTVDYLS